MVQEEGESGVEGLSSLAACSVVLLLTEGKQTGMSALRGNMVKQQGVTLFYRMLMKNRNAPIRFLRADTEHHNAIAN